MSLLPAEKLALSRQLTASNSAVMPGVRRGHQVSRPETPAFWRSFVGTAKASWERVKTHIPGERMPLNDHSCLFTLQISCSQALRRILMAGGRWADARQGAVDVSTKRAGMVPDDFGEAQGLERAPTDLTCPRTAHFPSPAVIHGHDMLILHAVVLGWGHTVARSNQH